MIFEDPHELRRRISEVTPRETTGRVNIFEDTSEFMSILAGDVLRLAGNDYLVVGHAREGRFGIDEQPKFWVKSSVDLTTGARKIIKLAFRETFDSRIGETVFHCTRSPEKESKVLQKMRGDPHFMQGQTVRDAAGNPVRVLDFISGPSLYGYLREQDMSHEEYYRRNLPHMLKPLIECVEAIAALHRQGLHHGDIRADHLFMKDKTEPYAWIDFDYVVDSPDYDLFCLGNVLEQWVGKGRHSLHDIRHHPSDYPALQGELTSGDMSLMFRHRVINLRKLYPYISPDLNDILMRFSAGASDPYKSMDSLLNDLRSVSKGLTQ